MHLPNGTGKLIIVVAILIAIGTVHVIYQAPAKGVDAIKPKFIFDKPPDASTTPSATPSPSQVDFERQKAHFKLKKQNRLQSIRSAAQGNRLADLQMYVVPQLACATMVRVGIVGDGGKWICNPWRVPQKDCVIYSLGVNGDVSFETEVYEVTERRCRIYSLDVGAQNLNLFKPFNGVFVQGKMTGSVDPAQNATSVAELMRQFNHKRIDILKMDIEGWEFDSLNGFFNASKIDDKQTSVCQLLVELHHNGQLSRWTNMFELLEKKGFRMFSKEANMYCPQCFEFSYIHLACLQEYGLPKDAAFVTLFD